MKEITLLVFAILLIGCDPYGDIMNINGTKLLSITYKQDKEKWVEDFEYDSLDRLVKVSDMQEVTGRVYTIEYDDERIVKVRKYDLDDGTEIYRDSFVYTPGGLMEKDFFINSKTGIAESAYEYEYDSTGVLSVKKFVSFNPLEYLSYDKYYWENGNVVRAEEFDANWNLLYEFFYEYDNKINYSSILPYLIFEPLSRNKNNVTKSSWNDYNGDLDIICNPCITKYDYNLDGFPIKILQEGKRKLELKYQ